MKNLMLLVIVGSLLVISACSSITVTSDFDKTVDFTKFKTYSFHGWDKNSDEILTPFDKERFERAFVNEFSSRGMTFVKEGGDITVALFIHTQQKQQTTATTTGPGLGYDGGYGGYWGYGPGWGWGSNSGMTTTTYNTYEYTVGTLVCDVFDTNEKKLIWEGVGQKTIDGDLQAREKNISEGVAKIMTLYPVSPVSKK